MSTSLSSRGFRRGQDRLRPRRGRRVQRRGPDSATSTPDENGVRRRGIEAAPHRCGRAGFTNPARAGSVERSAVPGVPQRVHRTGKPTPTSGALRPNGWQRVSRAADGIRAAKRRAGPPPEAATWWVGVLKAARVRWGCGGFAGGVAVGWSRMSETCLG